MRVAIAGEPTVPATGIRPFHATGRYDDGNFPDRSSRRECDMTFDSEHGPGRISDRLRDAGVAGAGGAGFPAHVKWRNPEGVDYLLINHQESEPIYYSDKWLAREHADELGRFTADLLETVFDVIVVGTKEKYQEEWMRSLEEATDAAIHLPDALPLDVDDESGLVVAYTPDVYTYSEESVLLMVTAGVQVGDEVPTEHGWIVHNTESVYNIYRALRDGTPVTRKYVHVGGNTPRHRCLDVPIGTPATTVLEAAGVHRGTVGPNEIMADGGPGWCYEISRSREFGVRKRTNALLVLDRDRAIEQTGTDGQIDVLDTDDWDRGHETEPQRLEPAQVRIPLITNEAYEGLVAPSEPVVDVGDTVVRGDVVARPASDGISNTQHASIDGAVAAVTDSHVVIERS